MTKPHLPQRLRTVLATVLIPGAAFLAAGCPSRANAAEGISVLERVEASRSSNLYPFNRAPLNPNPFARLPIGAVRPRGWVRQMLETERTGMTGRLKEISPWLDFSKSSWSDKQGRGKFGWEEMPYWLKGYGDLGYVLKDQTMMTEAKRWIDAALASQREDGWFGPRELLTSLEGKPDLWPHMVMLNVLQSYYEQSGDSRVLPAMTRYMRWQNTLPVSAFGEGYWPRIRMGDNIETCHWLYNRTGDAFLLELAAKMHQGMARWDQDVINWHNVNIAQGFRAGTVFWTQSGDPAHLASAERNFTKVMEMYGQFPGGGFVGDENSRPGFTDPRGGIETCGIVEFMHSFQMLMRITGDPVWIDRCEDIAFNSFPASMPADQRSLHYITSANQVQLDQHNKSPAIQNGGTMFSYSPFEVYRCCQHNVSHGWPYYAEELWLATHDGGLCASLYSASEVTARVAGGTEVTISEDTDYPFSGVITFNLSPAQPVAFPLYLRVPRWCDQARVTINGKTDDAVAKPLSYFVINRTWKRGDTVRLALPMRLAVTTWRANQNAASVAYGPLSFSLDIKERWQKYGNRDEAWPEWEVFPESPWNYGLELDPAKPTESLKLTQAVMPSDRQPWTRASAPLRIHAKARKITGWKLDSLNVVGKLQPSPVRSTEPAEEVELIPMGAARLRISMFPVIGQGPDAQEWTDKASAFQASHCHSSDTPEAVNDGLPAQPGPDADLPRFTWWDHKGTAEWIEWAFEKPRRLSGVEVYWFDDIERGGGCAVPQSWKLLVRQGDKWLPAQTTGEFGTAARVYNRVSIEPLEAQGLRIEAQLQPGKSAGIVEWRVLD